MNPQQKNVSLDFKKQEQKNNLPTCISLGEAEPLSSTGRRCGCRSVRRTPRGNLVLRSRPLFPFHAHSRRNLPQSPGLLPDLTPLLCRSPRPELGPRGGWVQIVFPPTAPRGQTWSYSTCLQTSPGKMEEQVGSCLRVCPPKEFHFVNFSEN